ncbi:cytochrome bd oxidase small subunit CydS [Paenibacillus lutrae]|nr:hypothetical protein [Paenibacillus lutrae]
MDYFLITYAPPIVVGLSLLFVFLWSPRAREVTEPGEDTPQRERAMKKP